MALLLALGKYLKFENPVYGESSTATIQIANGCSNVAVKNCYISGAKDPDYSNNFNNAIYIGDEYLGEGGVGG